MSKTIVISIWDEDAKRGKAIEEMLRHTMHECGIKGEVLVHCEPPMVARSGFAGRTPIIQFGDQTWECKSKTITQEGISTLVARMFMD